MWKMLMENSPLSIQHLFQLEGQTYRNMREEWCMMTCHPHMSQRTKLFKSKTPSTSQRHLQWLCLPLCWLSKDPPVGSKADIATPRITIPPIPKRIDLSAVLKAKIIIMENRGKSQFDLLKYGNLMRMELIKKQLARQKTKEKQLDTPSAQRSTAKRFLQCSKIITVLILWFLAMDGPQAAKVSEIGPYAGCTCIACKNNKLPEV